MQVRWPDWEVGCCEGRGERESPVVLYYAKIKVRHHVPTTGPVKWHNSSRKVNPLCLSVMHEESGGGGWGDGRPRSLSTSSSGDHYGTLPLTTGFESHSGGGSSGPKRLFGVSPTRVVHHAPPSDITGIGGGLKDDSQSNVSTGSILTQFLAPLDMTSCVEGEDRSELTVTVSGWVEVLNRSLNYTQLAYIITVSYKGDKEAAQATKWTTLRTQEDLEEIFAQINQEQKQERDSIRVEDEGQQRILQSSASSPVNSVSDGEAGGYVSPSTETKGERVSGSGKDQWSIMDRDEEDRLVDGGESQKRQQQRGRGWSGGDDKGTSDSGGATPSRLQRAKRSVLRRSRVNIQRHDIAPNHLYPADQNVLIMTNRILKALSSNNNRDIAPEEGSKEARISKSKTFCSSDSLMTYEDFEGNKSSPAPSPAHLLVRRTSLDDGSGTRQETGGRSNSEDASMTEKAKHQSLSLRGGSEQLSLLQGYLSDSSVPIISSSKQRTDVPLHVSMASPEKHTDKDTDEDKDAEAANPSSPSPSPSSSSSFSSVQIAKKAFLTALSAPQILDTWFLSEDSDKYLRAPPAKTKKGASPAARQVTIVARALWDSHWREEIAVVYPAHIAFYPLLAKKASWTLHLQELIGISHLNDATSPLPGFSILRIETIGRLHYLAFSSKENCNIMAASVLEHFSEITFDSSSGGAMPPAGDAGDPRDRFVLKSGRWRPAGRRLILNARKFLFDVEDKLNNSLLPTESSNGSSGSDSSGSSNQHGSSGPQKVGGAAKLDFSANGAEPYWRFAERLLKSVFRLELSGGSTSDAEGLFPGREMVIKFLDETVKLKKINLQKDVNFSSPEALCFFTNIYHTLLMHARLVLGPPNNQVMK